MLPDLFEEESIDTEEESPTVCARCGQKFRKDQMEMEVYSANYREILSDAPHCWICAGDLREETAEKYSSH